MRRRLDRFLVLGGVAVVASAAQGQPRNAVSAVHYDWVDEFGEGVEGVFHHLNELEMGRFPFDLRLPAVAA